jgi:hypothetical protein
VIRPPNQLENELFIQLEFECTNNQAKYEALVSGLDILIEMGVRRVEIFGDSKLVIQQIKGKSQCLDGRLNAYLEKCMDLLRDLEWYKAEHIRQEDRKANSLVQQASGYDVKRGWFGIRERLTSCDVLVAHEEGSEPSHADDWRQALIRHLSYPGSIRDQKIRWQALKYTLINGELYQRTVGVLLRCLSKEESRVAMGEVHEGLYGAHLSAHKLRWMLRRVGVYWPDMIPDCFKYYKGCKSYLKFGKVHMAPANTLHPIIKPWPFRGWGLDFIGMVHPSSS